MINLKRFKFSKKYFSSTNPLSFAVIGAGPAGVFTAKHVLEAYENSTVDFYDKIPHPYGLVRTGIAPDHQDMKKVENELRFVLEDKRSRFMGNVEIGKDVPFELVRKNYSSIILSYGADSENNLGIKNENAIGSYSAKYFVQWYNGHVFNCRRSIFFTEKFNLREVKDVVIVGNGNVAIDVARVLSKAVSDLKQYDVADPILDVLSNSGVRNIHIVARRGLMHAAFTTKEIRELSKVANISVYKDELEMSLNSSQAHLNALNPAERRQISRKMDLVKSFNIVEKGKESDSTSNNSNKKNIFLRFLLTPQEISVNKDNRVTGISFTRTKDSNNTQDDFVENLKADLIFKSIGYKSVKLFEEIAFDNKKSIIVNKDGIVFDANMNPCHNIFTTGWVKTGPRGIIDST